MVKHNSEPQRPADISNSSVEFMTDEELDQAIAEASARHPASRHDELPEEETQPVEMAHFPLHKVLDNDKPHKSEPQS